MSEKKIGVLFVCLGNICRSPLAEGVFRHLVIAEGLEKHFLIDSVGTSSWHVGEPPDERGREAGLIAEDLYPGLLAAYEGRLSDETKLYDGVLDCLDVLEAAGWRLGVCTNKPERLAVMLLDSLGVLERFGAVLGADSLPVRKPNPEHLHETARRSGARPDLCVMLGDTRTDLLTARAAGVPCVLTSFGFAAEPLDDLPADAVVHHFDEVAPVLERLRPRPAETA